MTQEESLKAVHLIYHALDSKLAKDIRVIEIGDVSPVADYFVIATGSSDHQIEALVDAVDEAMTKEGFRVNHIEGFRRAGWTLMDYGDVVVHIFDPESRDFYNLERIWKDGRPVTIDDTENTGDPERRDDPDDKL